jgi:hypothetical protein
VMVEAIVASKPKKSMCVGFEPKRSMCVGFEHGVDVAKLLKQMWTQHTMSYNADIQMTCPP